MATPSSIKSNHSRRVREIENSSLLSDEEKESFIFKLNHALEGTNGLSQKDKLQSVSEDVYWLTESSSRQLERYNKVLEMISEESAKSDASDKELLNRLSSIDAKMKTGGTLYSLLSESKWAIVVLGSVICALLAFRPELSAFF